MNTGAQDGGILAGAEALPLGVALERVDFGVVLTDDRGLVRWCNPTVAEYYLKPEYAGNWQGRPHHEVLGDLFEERDRKRVGAALSRLHSTPKGRVEIEGLALAWGGGRRRAMNLVLADLGVGASAPMPGWTAWYLYDVTRQRQVDENLQALLRHSTDGIFMIDAECHIRVFNQACERITGWSAAEVLLDESSCRRVFACESKDCPVGLGPERAPKQPVECIREMCFKRSATGALTDERLIRTRSGDERWVEISYAPVVDDNGAAAYVLGIVRDTTPRRKLEEQLRLSRKLATLGELTSAMAHEIRNPLGIILSAAEILSNPNRPEDQKRQAAEFIREESKRLDERIQIFLKFSRPKQPDFVIQNIHRVLTQTIVAYQTLARQNLTICTEFAAGLPSARLDADQMQQVFLNLLMNADQAMPAGGTITIRTSSGADGKIIEVEVADEGIGLPEGQTGRLFEPFFSTKPKGTGLGLSIVMQIVGAHGGTVRSTNRTGGGASFTVSLPAVGSANGG